MKTLIAWLCLAAALWGQGAARIDIIGTVRDFHEGTPLLGANVTLTGGRMTNMVGSATDQTGQYRIPNIPPGIYQLHVSYIGYRSVQREVEVEPGLGPLLEVNIELKVESIELQGYVVTASRGKREKITEAPAATIVVSSIEIRRSTHPNLGDYFKHIKGVDFTASGIDGFNLSARGFNTSFSSRLMTLTDGRKANVPSLRLIAYNTIPLTSDDVDQIEIVLGPSSALYGPDAYSGVVNIISKKPRLSAGGIVTVAAGNRDFRKWQMRYAGFNGKWGYKFSYADFSATDWRWVDPEEKKGHHKFWTEDGGKKGAEMDNNTYPSADAPYPWIWDGYDIRFDRDNNGNFFDINDDVALATDYITADVNADGIADTADFRVENERLDFRLDYDFGPDHSLIASFGQAVATNINITGIGRFLADQFTLRYYQMRYVNGLFFAQAYLNTSNAGRTRNLRTGDRIFDESTFFHLQTQHTLSFSDFFDTQVSYGFDYQRTTPKTFGTILPDGTGGKKPKSYDRDGKDNDGDGDIDEFGEGLIITNEYGIYFQSTSHLTQRLKFILASRVDLHNGVLSADGFSFLDDPILGGTVNYRTQFSPKVGILWSPDEDQTIRLTAARAFNTPSSQGLYLDIKVGQFEIFPVRARGNHSGYSYTRNSDGKLMMHDVRHGPTAFKFAVLPDDAVLIIPAVLGRPALWVQPEDLTDIAPVTSEDIWTYELGYAGVLGARLRATLDLHYSQYSDFVSDLTWITPVVLDTSQGLDNAIVLGLIGTSAHDGIDEGPDGEPGTPDDVPVFDDPIELTLTNINYGRVNVWGLDMSLAYFIMPRLWGEVRFSYLGRQAFFNRLTRSNDPINAPQYKLSASTIYTSRHNRYWIGLAFRHVPTFDWAAGVFVGTIPGYTVADLNLGYHINETYTIKANVNNLNNDVHAEIIGGAKLGRQFILALTLVL